MAKKLWESIKGFFSTKKLSWVGHFFKWLDMNIFDKSSRLWVYLLEIAGVVVIFTIVDDVQKGLKMISVATTDIQLKVAESYMNSLISLAPALATMVATICGALPTIIGIMRTLNKKWNGSTDLLMKKMEMEEQKTPPKDETIEGA